MKLTISLPDELAPFEDDLEYFMNTMIRKLFINRHKGYAEGRTPADLFKGLQEEVAELARSLYNESQFEGAMEAIDVANMAFLVALRLWSMTKVEYVNTPEASGFRDDVLRDFRLPNPIPKNLREAK